MLNFPLIQPDWTFAIWAALTFLATIGFWADKTKIGQNISGAAIILAAGMLLSNIGVLPRTSEVYDSVWGILVPLAIPLLLLKADLRRVFTETKGMLVAFFFGALGTTIGALIGYFLLPLGEEAPRLAGVFSATYIGGLMNMTAVANAVELDKSIMAASVAADNVVGVFYLAFLALVPSLALFRWWFKESEQATETEAKPTPIHKESETADPQIDLRHIGLALGLSFAICAMGKAIASALGIPGYSIMFITAIAVVVANVVPAHLKKLKGDYEVGLFLMYLFFAVVGTGADIEAMLQNAIIIVAYASIIITCHAVVIFGASRFFKIELMEVVIASNACASGPATAAALAAGKGRKDLVAPAVLIGVLGYVVANFIGVLLSKSLGG